eukprot:NODE_8233_length_366_cov_97.432177_g6494_i0.p1 GENE.NODE_8233_length_366_cov_97.432177_g6494_i0~~NODE_8233_length_366_cov_97.432177_g6494_i0.p1  ORF type:complete len:106 (+),score=39.83 NODE_8233_length_366_cov_97.432177_g6494_i0:25-318(+)
MGVKDAYLSWFKKLLDQAEELTTIGPSRTNYRAGAEYKFFYDTREEFVRTARQLQLMNDFKDNVPRTAYHGIVTYRQKTARIHLVPRLKLYDYTPIA